MAGNSTPAGIASLMWNHAPVMFASIRKQGLTMPQLCESQAADLFAFFYSAHYFERPGEAQRCKALFSSKARAGGHALTKGSPTARPPASAGSALTDPTAMIHRRCEP